MTRPKKYTINLTNEEFKELKSVIHKKNISKMIRRRCQILIDLDEAHDKVLTHEQCARVNGVCMATVANTVTKYINRGLSYVLQYRCSVNSDQARRKLDGRAGARIIELACGPAPQGHSRWTIRLLGNIQEWFLNPLSASRQSGEH